MSTHWTDKTPTGRAGDGYRDVDLEQKTFSLLQNIQFTKQDGKRKIVVKCIKLYQSNDLTPKRNLRNGCFSSNIPFDHCRSEVNFQK